MDRQQAPPGVDEMASEGVHSHATLAAQAQVDVDSFPTPTGTPGPTGAITPANTPVARGVVRSRVVEEFMNAAAEAAAHGPHSGRRHRIATR